MLSAVWRARWVVVAAALLAGVAGYSVSSLQAVTYTAESRVVLSASQTFHPLGNQSYQDPTRFLSNQVSIMSAGPVLDIAARQLGPGVTSQSLADSLAVTAAGDSDVIVVSVSAGSAEAAADRANAVVEAYRVYMSEGVREEARAAVSSTEDPGVADRIRTEAAVYGDGVAVVEPAMVPSAPSGPKPVRDAALIGVVAGLVTAGAAVWRRANFASLPVSDVVNAPVLGVVPVRHSRRKAARPAHPEEHALALVALDYARAGAKGPVLVTATAEDSGAASVAYGLGLSAAAENRRVLLVDADPETRELVGRLGIDEPRMTLDGLDVLALPVSEITKTVPGPAVSAPPLTIATLGSADPDARTDVEAVQRSFAKLSPSFDLVLIQVAPVSQDAFAYSLLRVADAVVAVVRENDSPGAAFALRERLDNAHRNLTGIILTNRVRGAFLPTWTPVSGAADEQKTGNMVSPAPQTAGGRPSQ